METKKWNQFVLSDNQQGYFFSKTYWETSIFTICFFHSSKNIISEKLNYEAHSLASLTPYTQIGIRYILCLELQILEHSSKTS